MSVFSRFARIIRANLSRDSDREPFADPDFQEIFTEYNRNYRQSKSYESQHTKRASSGQDPELARYYANLEVPYGSDLETVRKAWKKMLRQYHPDLHSDDAEKSRVANELVQGLNKAYDELEKRLGAKQ